MLFSALRAENQRDYGTGISPVTGVGNVKVGIVCDVLKDGRWMAGCLIISDMRIASFLQLVIVGSVAA